MSEININSLIRSYDRLMNASSLKSILQKTDSNYSKNLTTKIEIIKRINEIFKEKYKGAEFYKFILTEEHLNSENVCAYEVRALNSRVDFLVIGEKSIAYEIKSINDNLDRLEGQIQNYLKIFEYVNIIAEEKTIRQIKEKLPYMIGLYTINNFKIIEIKKPEYNNFIEPECQLKCLTKEERRNHFKSDNNDTILLNFDKNEINISFKKIVSYKYLKKWNYLQKTAHIIEPIDYQYFFKNNINPNLIYYH